MQCCVYGKILKMYQWHQLIVLVACISTVFAKLDESLLTDELKDLMATLHQTCVDQIGVEEAQIDKLKDGVFEDDEKTKCYVKCVMSECGVMDENGDIDMAAFAEVIPEKLREKIKAVFDSCVSQADGITNHCDKAFKILRCSHDGDPEHYFFA